ncbi:HNH endonuclease [Bacillus subtilis]
MIDCWLIVFKKDFFSEKSIHQLKDYGISNNSPMKKAKPGDRAIIYSGGYFYGSATVIDEPKHDNGEDSRHNIFVPILINTFTNPIEYDENLKNEVKLNVRWAGKLQNSTYEVIIAKYLKKESLLESIKLDVESELAQSDEIYFKEGSPKDFYGKRYERNPENRLLAIQKHGLNCFVCGFNFEDVYGEHGKDFIEIHHIKPLSSFKKETLINPEKDMIPLCANCHRMIHRKRDKVLQVEELKKMIKR